MPEHKTVRGRRVIVAQTVLQPEERVRVKMELTKMYR